MNRFVDAVCGNILPATRKQVTETVSNLSHLEYAFAATRHAFDLPLNNSSSDGDIVECRYDLEGVKKAADRDTISAGPASLWRYAPLLPASAPDDAVTLGEGWTPLIDVGRLGERLGLEQLFVKDEGRNPSGCFKDRGASVALTRCRELGIETVVHNSSGNAAAAWSLYAARAGVTCVNVVPADTMPSCLAQCALSRARTFIFEGPWHQSGSFVREAVKLYGWFNVSTLREPYRMEGKKTLGLEIAEQLGWRLPDVVVYPVGGGLGPLAIYKGFRELEALGWLNGPVRMPRLIAAQYEGCAPIVRAFREGRERAEPWEQVDVLPGGLKGAAPPGDRGLLKLLRDTGGVAYTVSSDEALSAAAELTEAEGILPAPESATTLVALRKAMADELVGRDDAVVLVVTASGLKSLPNFKLPPFERIHEGQPIPRI